MLQWQLSKPRIISSLKPFNTGDRGARGEHFEPVLQGCLLAGPRNSAIITQHYTPTGTQINQATKLELTEEQIQLELKVIKPQLINMSA